MVKPRSDEFVLHGITSVESLVRRLRVTHSETCTYDKPVHDSRYPAICNCGAALKNEAANKIEALLTAIEAAPHS
ncbi:MAG TPA: hypothetical protein DG761_02550, partial [Gammaproteobacteria bacterium]|nr:hypothetical protein [Gammaproteobacteria bacterium]